VIALVLLPLSFLEEKLLLKIHEEKTRIRKIRQGVDFLDYVVFNKYKLIRTKTRKRILKKFRAKIEEYNKGTITKDSLSQSLQSYLGFCSHAESFELQECFKKRYLSIINNS